MDHQILCNLSSHFISVNIFKKSLYKEGKTMLTKASCSIYSGAILRTKPYKKLFKKVLLYNYFALLPSLIVLFRVYVCVFMFYYALLLYYIILYYLFVFLISPLNTNNIWSYACFFPSLGLSISLSSFGPFSVILMPLFSYFILWRWLEKNNKYFGGRIIVQFVIRLVRIYSSISDYCYLELFFICVGKKDFFVIKTLFFTSK